MSTKPTSTAPDVPVPAKPGAGDGMDWAAFDAMTVDEVKAAALADPDARPVDRPLSPAARRIGLHGVIRFQLRLSLAEFASRYHIPADVVTAWERGTITPDPVAQAYLSLIAADPDGIAAALAQAAPAHAAE